MKKKSYDRDCEIINGYKNNLHFEVRHVSARKYDIILTTKIPQEIVSTYCTFKNQEEVKKFFFDTYRLISMCWYPPLPE